MGSSLFMGSLNKFMTDRYDQFNSTDNCCIRRFLVPAATLVGGTSLEIASFAQNFIATPVKAIGLVANGIVSLSERAVRCISQDGCVTTSLQKLSKELPTLDSFAETVLNVFKYALGAFMTFVIGGVFLSPAKNFEWQLAMGILTEKRKAELETKDAKKDQPEEVKKIEVSSVAIASVTPSVTEKALEDVKATATEIKAAIITLEDKADKVMEAVTTELKAVVAPVVTAIDNAAAAIVAKIDVQVEKTAETTSETQTAKSADKADAAKISEDEEASGSEEASGNEEASGSEGASEGEEEEGVAAKEGASPKKATLVTTAVANAEEAARKVVKNIAKASESIGDAIQQQTESLRSKIHTEFKATGTTQEAPTTASVAVPSTLDNLKERFTALTNKVPVDNLKERFTALTNKVPVTRQHLSQVGFTLGGIAAGILFDRYLLGASVVGASAAGAAASLLAGSGAAAGTAGSVTVSVGVGITP